jgi:DNA modification methylase
MTDNDRQLAQLTHLDTMLARSTHIDEITNIRDRARAMQVYAKNIKASKEETIPIAITRIRAERRAGQELIAMKERGELSTPGGDTGRNQYEAWSSDSTMPHTVTLEDMHISKYQSSKWQTMALIPEDVFEELMCHYLEYLQEPTTEGIANNGKRYKTYKKTNPTRFKPTSDIKILHGDMFDVLPTLDDGKIGLVIADPPYNVTEWEWDKIGSDNDFVAITEQWLDAITPLLASEYNLFWFCSPKYIAAIEPVLSARYDVQSRIVWHRRNMAMGSDSTYKFIDTWEMIFHCGNKPMNWNVNWDDSRFDVQTFAVPQTNFSDTKYHPTQKPLDLIDRLVEYGSWPGDIVLDPFAGSGTTGAVCQNLGRDCVLIEREKGYVDVIKQRLSK